MSGSSRRLTFATTGLVAAALTLPIGLATASSAAAAPARTPKPCVSSGCSIVSRADVDGDGRADTTSLTRRDKGKAYTLRVVTASGRVASTSVATPWLQGTGVAPFRGAVALDGARGSELVVLTGMGAHTSIHNVYTWRSGRLVAEKDPSGSTEWVTDGALSFSKGYTLRTVKGARQLTSISLVRDSWGTKATFTGTRIVARWQKGRWTPITERAVRMPEGPAVWSGAGWNVKGLARF
ncbi:hypothetical protein [Mobilicoccus massiliensis]|uniref:hypothetical protein n=1 Tax=Mobilicoccus massiliensis TaxID=1522310 RepID=UPI00059091E7|nr:hypothetical protein [Mobilicoccus massiliensis]